MPVGIGRTPNLALPFPTLSDPGGADITAIEDLALALDDVSKFAKGLAANRPAAGVVGRHYYETDTGKEGLDIGAAWVYVTPTIANGAIGAAQLADGAVTDAKVSGVSGAKLAAGTVPGAALADETVTAGKLAAALKPSEGAGGGTEALRSIGGAAGQVAAGNDPRLVGVPPIGSMQDYAGAADPNANWMICNGRALSRADYGALFNALGVAFGAGDGAATFNLPDLRGRVSVGAGPGAALTDRALAAKGGEEAHVLSVEEAPSLPVYSEDHGGGLLDNVAGTVAAYTVGGGNGRGLATRGDGAFAVGFRATGGGGAHNNMPPFVVVNKIIRVL